MTRKRSWSDEDLVNAVANNYSMASVLRTLGLNVSGGTHRNVAGHIERMNLDTSHFTGQTWNKGVTNLNAPRKPLTDILVEHSTFATGHLKRRLIEENQLKYCCSICGISEWMGKTISLHLDHINGTHTDNRLINLRLLCPNCHSQTETYCRRKPR